MMVKIPNVNNITAQAIASRKLTGHIAICGESQLYIHTFKIKESSGRSKSTYADFDHIYRIELFDNFKPTKLYFLSNYLCGMNTEKCIVFKISKLDDDSDEKQDHLSNSSSSKAAL